MKNILIAIVMVVLVFVGVKAQTSADCQGVKTALVGFPGFKWGSDLRGAVKAIVKSASFPLKTKFVNDTTVEVTELIELSDSSKPCHLEITRERTGNWQVISISYLDTNKNGLSDAVHAQTVRDVWSEEKKRDSVYFVRHGYLFEKSEGLFVLNCNGSTITIEQLPPYLNHKLGKWQQKRSIYFERKKK